MKVLLLADVSGIGRRDEIHDVSAGYVRNFLLPKKLATLVTPAVLAQYTTRQKSFQANARAERDEQDHLAQRLPDLRLVVTARANDKGQLYGSVTPDAIAAELHNAGITIPTDAIHVNNPLTNVGEHTVTVVLRPDLHIPLTFSIQPT